MTNPFKNIGPGVLVAAAFIGPGTVTACTLAGANFGYALLWALVFATVATVILQEMSARLGIVTKKGLGENLIDELHHSIFKWPLIGLLLIALYGGNAAYEGGNLAGATLGIHAIVGSESNYSSFATLLLAILAITILWRGAYKDIERILIGLVMVMCLAFVLTFLVVQPNLLSMFKGMFQPSIPDGSLMTVIALIGTTVVPYNLFLHAAAVKNHWSETDKVEQNLQAARRDTGISIGLGGVVAILIVSTAAASIYASALNVQNAADMAVQFEPLFGALSKYLLGIGLFAAGLSSAITAPLATGYAVSELLRFKGGSQTNAFRAVCISIVVIGATLSLAGIKPLKLIVLAQFANGLLLPIVACFLLYAANRSAVLGKHTNGFMANLLGAIIVLFTAALGAKSILAAIGFL